MLNMGMKRSIIQHIGVMKIFRSHLHHSFGGKRAQYLLQRWNNKRDIKSYLEGYWKNENEMEYLDLHALAEERLMLGLRTRSLNLHVLKRNMNFHLQRNISI